MQGAGFTLERWKYFAITHENHAVCNPLSLAKIDEMIDRLGLSPGSRVLDIACGKAELLIRLAERVAIQGIGVDWSPYCIRDARETAVQRQVEGRLRFVEQDGQQFDAGPDPYDLSMCIGASWVFGGHPQTVAALRDRTRPGGLVLVGEPYWLQNPPEGYLRSQGITRAAYVSHLENVRAAESAGLRLLYTIVSSADDWDRYEGLQWQAAERYAVSHPDDVDVPELLERVRCYRDAYLSAGRDVLGWSLYLFTRD